MSKKRIKVELNTETLNTREDAEASMNELALAENNKRKFIAARDAAVLKVQENSAPLITQCEQFIEAKAAELQAWAESHPEAFPKGRKSIDLAAGTLGFRTGTPKLALLSRAWNWKKVTDALMVHLPNFIRSAPEPDKESLLAQREELAPMFPLIGVKVDQGESFFIEPNLTDTDARQQVS
jgi:phage host-nuclease inhibitor protein Gam